MEKNIQSEYHRRYYEENRDKIKSRAAEYREKNRELINAKVRAERLINPEKFRARDAKYEDKKKIGRKLRYSRNRVMLNAKVRAFRASNPEKFREYEKKRRSTENYKIRMGTYLKKYKDKNRDKILEYQKAWRAKNRDSISAKIKEWCRLHPENIRSAGHKRKMLMSAHYHESVVKFIKRIRSLKVVDCYYCKTPIRGSDAHIDHIVAISKGGNHCSSNVCASCESCNLSKNNKSLSQWIKHGQTMLEI